MTKIDQLIEEATDKDFDFVRGHTRTLDPEKLIRLVAEDCYKQAKERALGNPWTKSAFQQLALDIATAYNIPVDKMDFIKFTDVTPHTHIMDLVEWHDAISTGAINSDDGDGYWMKHGQVSDVDCFDLQPTWATHVAWYNK